MEDRTRTTRGVKTTGPGLRGLPRGIPSLKPRALSLEPSRPPAGRGFNLVELMFSILILGVGLVAVASLFPVAGTLQQETMDDVLAMQAARNVRQTFDVDVNLWAQRGITGAWLDTQPSVLPGRTGVLAQLDPVLLQARWPIDDRRFAAADPANRCFYWTALFRRKNPTAVTSPWEAYLFIFKATEQYPAVNFPPADPAYSADRDALVHPVAPQPAEAGELVVTDGPQPRAGKMEEDGRNTYWRGAAPGLLKIVLPPVEVP